MLVHVCIQKIRILWIYLWFGCVYAYKHQTNCLHIRHFVNGWQSLNNPSQCVCGAAKAVHVFSVNDHSYAGWTQFDPRSELKFSDSHQKDQLQAIGMLLHTISQTDVVEIGTSKVVWTTSIAESQRSTQNRIHGIDA